MLAPANAVDENKRIRSLQNLNLLDSTPEERFDRLTRLIQHLYSVPIALISLVDSNRQWFLSRCGLDATETSRDISFCGHAILEEHVFVIEDTLLDERFADNPLVTGPPHIRFYAGAQLKHPNGSALGTLCLISPKPKMFTSFDRKMLKEIAIFTELELTCQSSSTLDEETQLSNKSGFNELAVFSRAICKSNHLPMGIIGIKIDDKHLHEIKNIVEKVACWCLSSEFIGRHEPDIFLIFSTNSNAAYLKDLTNKIKQQLDSCNYPCVLEASEICPNDDTPTNTLIEHIVAKVMD